MRKICKTLICLPLCFVLFACSSSDVTDDIKDDIEEEIDDQIEDEIEDATEALEEGENNLDEAAKNTLLEQVEGSFKGTLEDEGSGTDEIDVVIDGDNIGFTLKGDEVEFNIQGVISSLAGSGKKNKTIYELDITITESDYAWFSVNDVVPGLFSLDGTNLEMALNWASHSRPSDLSNSADWFCDVEKQ